MKKLIALTLITVAITSSARAQWIVYDPASNIQGILNTAQEIAKFVEVINNQVQQIQALTDQLNEFKHYEDLFGDPKRIVVSTIAPLVTDLRRTELGESLGEIIQAADGAAALTYNAQELCMRSANRS